MQYVSADPGPKSLAITSIETIHRKAHNRHHESLLGDDDGQRHLEVSPRVMMEEELYQTTLRHRECCAPTPHMLSDLVKSAARSQCDRGQWLFSICESSMLHRPRRPMAHEATRFPHVYRGNRKITTMASADIKSCHVSNDESRTIPSLELLCTSTLAICNEVMFQWLFRVVVCTCALSALPRFASWATSALLPKLAECHSVPMNRRHRTSIPT